jgi:hypothetical protein
MQPVYFMVRLRLTTLYALMTTYDIMTYDNIPLSLFYDPHATFPLVLILPYALCHFSSMPYATFPLSYALCHFFLICPMPYAFMSFIQKQDMMTFKFKL